MQQSPYLKAAINATNKAGNYLRSNFGNRVQITKKGGNFRNLVTDADRKSETIIKNILLKKYPRSQVLGEETEFGKRHSEYLWVVDPIDGTTNFTQKIPYFAILIALLKGDEIILGVTYNPITKDIYFAEKGHGAYHNGKKIHTSNVAHLERAFGALTWGKNFQYGSRMASAFIKTARKIRINGSAGLSMCEVAAGRYDFIVSGGHIHFWDIAAGIITVREAGGITTDKNCKDPSLEQKLHEVVTAATSTLHQQLVNFSKKRVWVPSETHTLNT